MIKKIITGIVSLLAILLVTNPASAATEIVDLGTLQAGETYDIPEYKGVTAQYTPAASGPVKFVWTSVPITLYSSSDHSEQSIVEGTHSYTDAGQVISYAHLDAGTTYYLYTAMSIMGGTLRIIEGDTVIELVSVEPAADPEIRFSVSKDYRIYVLFNYPVTIGNSYLIAGSEREKINPIVSGALVSCDVNDVIMNFYHDGKIKEGDKLTLRIMQVKDASNPDNKYNETGRFETDFVMAAKPAEVVETKGFDLKAASNTLNSYYFSDDENALMQLTFDTPLDPARIPVADITYGNPDNLDLGIYRESIKGSIDGNTATFDFSGKLRRRIDMLPGATPEELPANIFVSFGDIYSADGQRAYTGMMSNPNGFSVSFLANDLQYSIAADFVPARGAKLTPGTEMEIWVMNGAMVNYDNICIDYTCDGISNTITIPAEDIRTLVDPESMSGLDMLYYFTVPEYTADAGSKVYVYMNGLTCADGLDHSGDVYGDFAAATAGISGISGDNADTHADIYDITGRLVLRGASVRDIRSLDKGIYIYKGKKVINN